MSKVVITNTGPTSITRGFEESEESKATRISELERNVQISPVRGTTTLTLTFPTVTDREYWIEQNAEALNYRPVEPRYPREDS